MKRASNLTIKQKTFSLRARRIRKDWTEKRSNSALIPMKNEIGRIIFFLPKCIRRMMLRITLRQVYYKDSHSKCVTQVEKLLSVRGQAQDMEDMKDMQVTAPQILESQKKDTKTFLPTPRRRDRPKLTRHLRPPEVLTFKSLSLN